MPAWGLRRARRAWGLLAVLGALSMLAAHAPPAGAVVVFDRAVHKAFSFTPTIGQGAGTGTSRAAGRARSAGFSCTTSCTQLLYHNGPVQHGENVYLLFWAPSSYSPAFPASYISGMGTWVNDVAGANGTLGNPISVGTQYYDLSGPGGAKSFVPYAVTNGGTLQDTNAYPSSGCSHGTTCLTDAQIRAELSAYIQAHSLPTGLGVQYFVMFPQGVNSCFDAGGTSCSYTQFCGYHSYTAVAGNQVTYADMPWLYNASGCDAATLWGGTAGHANSNFVDPVVNVFSHELAETMTDPMLNAWYDASGNENGDKCNFLFSQGGQVHGLNTNGLGYWDQQLGNDLYLIQEEFNNRVGNCVPAMTATWSGATPTGASASNWSSGTNWAATLSPNPGSTSNAVIDTLSFPALASGACTAQPPTATCYTANNDLTSLSAYGLSVDGGSGYAIGGNGLTLGAGGITSTSSASSSNPSSVSPPITLGANQTWSIDGGAHKVGQLALGGTVTGSSTSVAISLSNAGSLVLGGDDEVGFVAITGANSANAGTNALLNGSVTVNSALNGSDGSYVNLTHAGMLVPGSATVSGGLTSIGGDIEAGRGTVPAGAMTVQGWVSLDATSALKLFIDHSGPAGLDYSQLVAHGNVTLAGSLVLSGGTSCPSLTTGDQFTLITTTGSLSGTFSGIANGQDVALSCSGTQPSLQINYSANAVTATVVSLSQPSNTSLPAISGTAQHGQNLGLTQGQWTNTPTSTSDQWQVCDSSGASCSAIPGATSNTYMPTAEDVGHTIRVHESATNAAGTGGPVSSTQTSVVTAAGGGSGGGGSGGGAGTLTSGTPSVSGSLVDVPLTCTGAAGAQCAVTLTLTVTETTSGGKLIAVTAAAHGTHKKKKTRVVVVGSATVTLSAGQSQLLQVVLNAVGRQLLALRHVLTANLAVVQAGQRISSSTITFHGKSNRRRHRKR